MIIERTTSASYGSHHEIIGQVVAGDRDAGEKFVVRYGPLVHSILRRLDMRDDDKDDLFQQVFVMLWEHDCRRLKSWRGDAKFTTFLGVVTKNLGYDRIRRSGASRVHCLSDIIDEIKPVQTSGDDPVARVIKEQQKSALKAAIGQLSARDSELINRRYYRHESYKEIGEALQLTVNHVGVALSRAEKRLRDQLKRVDGELFDFN